MGDLCSYSQSVIPFCVILYHLRYNLNWLDLKATILVVYVQLLSPVADKTHNDNKYNFIHGDSIFFIWKKHVYNTCISHKIRALYFSVWIALLWLYVSISSGSTRLIYSCHSELLQWLRGNLMISPVSGEANLMGTGKFSLMASLRWADCCNGTITFFLNVYSRTPIFLLWYSCSCWVALLIMLC